MTADREQLERHVRELQVRGANDREALVDLSQSLWLLGRFEEAIQAFKSLLRFEPCVDDPTFDEIYVEGLRETDTCPVPMRRRHRLMKLVELLGNSAAVSGAVVECGCFRGMSSYVLCSFLRRSDPSFDGGGYHIFDSFQGLSEPTLDDEIPDDWDNAAGLRRMSRPGSFAASLDRVRRSLQKFPGVTYHPGWIPLTFQGLPKRPYRFVHVDVDLYDPTLDAFRYFYPLLAPGGIIVSDDYSWPGARTAVDEFSAEAGIELEVTEFNQAVVRRRS